MAFQKHGQLPESHPAPVHMDTHFDVFHDAAKGYYLVGTDGRRQHFATKHAAAAYACGHPLPDAEPVSVGDLVPVEPVAVGDLVPVEPVRMGESSDTNPVPDGQEKLT